MDAMKISIQDRKTKMFFTEEGTWVKNSQEARGFPSALSAFNFALLKKFDDVEIVFVKNEPSLTLVH